MSIYNMQQVMNMCSYKEEIHEYTLHREKWRHREIKQASQWCTAYSKWA